MTTHLWGDGFDFASVDNAAYYIGQFCKRWGRLDVHDSKEKWGCVRVYLSFGWYQLHSLIYPGYAYNQFPEWLFYLDCEYFSRVIPYFNFFIVPYQKFIYRLAYKRAIIKWPHIQQEILQDADFREYLDGL